MRADLAHVAKFELQSRQINPKLEMYVSTLRDTCTKEAELVEWRNAMADQLKPVRPRQWARMGTPRRLSCHRETPHAWLGLERRWTNPDEGSRIRAAAIEGEIRQGYRDA